MKKEKLTYEEKYKKWAVEFHKDVLPFLPALQGQFKCVDAYLMAFGKVERDGKELEYQEVRIYLEPSEEKSQFEKDIREDQKKKCIESVKKGVNSKFILPAIIKAIMEADQ